MILSQILFLSLPSAPVIPCEVLFRHPFNPLQYWKRRKQWAVEGLILSDKNEKKLGRSDNISGIFRDPHYPLMVSFPVTSPMGLRVPEITPWWKKCLRHAGPWLTIHGCGAPFLGILGMPWGLAFNPGTDPWEDCIFLPTFTMKLNQMLVKMPHTHTHTWILWVMVWFRAGISTNWERCMEIYHACICFLTMLLVHLLDF